MFKDTDPDVILPIVVGTIICLYVLTSCVVRVLEIIYGVK